MSVAFEGGMEAAEYEGTEQRLLHPTLSAWCQIDANIVTLNLPLPTIITGKY